MTRSLPPAFLGRSPAIQRLRHQLDQAAGSSQEVLITGEPGTGKRLAAALLHHQGLRRNRPLIRLGRDTLAGFLKDARSHIYDQLPGDGPAPQPGAWISAVQGSTLLLEEVGEWSKAEQSGITGILRCRTKEKLGGIQPLEVDIQIIATTRSELAQAVNQGRFWPELYYRLRGFPIELPPLRDHREDIPLLAEHFLNRISEAHQQMVSRLSPVALELLLSHNWPGNVRELIDCLEKAAVLARGGHIDPQHLWANESDPATS